MLNKFLEVRGIRTKFILISCLIIIFGAGLLILNEVFEQKQLTNGIEQLKTRQNEAAITTFEKILDEDQSNEMAKVLLVKAKKLDFKEKTFALDKAYKAGDLNEVDRLANEILSKYRKDPLLGNMTDKIVYTQSKAQTKD